MTKLLKPISLSAQKAVESFRKRFPERTKFPVMYTMRDVEQFLIDTIQRVETETAKKILYRIDKIYSLSVKKNRENANADVFLEYMKFAREYGCPFRKYEPVPDKLRSSRLNRDSSAKKDLKSKLSEQEGKI